MKMKKLLFLFWLLPALAAPGQTVLGKHPADVIAPAFFNQNSNAEAVVAGVNKSSTKVTNVDWTLNPDSGTSGATGNINPTNAVLTNSISGTAATATTATNWIGNQVNAAGIVAGFWTTNFATNIFSDLNTNYYFFPSNGIDATFSNVTTVFSASKHCWVGTNTATAEAIYWGTVHSQGGFRNQTWNFALGTEYPLLAEDENYDCFQMPIPSNGTNFSNLKALHGAAWLQSDDQVSTITGYFYTNAPTAIITKNVWFASNTNSGAGNAAYYSGNTAYVDTERGNNSTAQLNCPSLPFATLPCAVTNLDTQGGGNVVLTKGQTFQVTNSFETYNDFKVFADGAVVCSTNVYLLNATLTCWKGHGNLDWYGGEIYVRMRQDSYPCNTATDIIYYQSTCYGKTLKFHGTRIQFNGDGCMFASGNGEDCRASGVEFDNCIVSATYAAAQLMGRCESDCFIRAYNSIFTLDENFNFLTVSNNCGTGGGFVFQVQPTVAASITADHCSFNALYLDGSHHVFDAVNASVKLNDCTFWVNPDALAGYLHCATTNGTWTVNGQIQGAISAVNIVGNVIATNGPGARFRLDLGASTNLVLTPL